MQRLIINTQNNFLYIVSDYCLNNCEQQKVVRKDCNHVQNYIAGAGGVQILLERTKCVICKERICHFETIFTDGVWMWSSDLNHYFEKHFFQFPEEFYRRLEQTEYQMPIISLDQSHELGEKYLDDAQSLALLKKQLL